MTSRCCRCDEKFTTIGRARKHVIQTHEAGRISGCDSDSSVDVTMVAWVLSRQSLRDTYESKDVSSLTSEITPEAEPNPKE